MRTASRATNLRRGSVLPLPLAVRFLIVFEGRPICRSIRSFVPFIYMTFFGLLSYAGCPESGKRNVFSGSFVLRFLFLFP